LLKGRGRAARKMIAKLMARLLGRWRPPHYFDDRLRWHARRHAFHVWEVCSAVGLDATVCDIGGGWGHFSACCSELGMRCILIDDSEDDSASRPRLEMSRAYGFTVQIRDVVESGIDFLPESVDAFTTFDCLEHLHHSPKALFAQVMVALRPGGLFFLGAPNCVNLRKRITVPLGRGRWSSMKEWYETPRFRGHVREPDVGDLRYIARDMGLEDVVIVGRNWEGLCHPRRAVRVVTRCVDLPLRCLPGLCSDIYLLGRKPRRAGPEPKTPGGPGR